VISRKTALLLADVVAKVFSRPYKSSVRRGGYGSHQKTNYSVNTDMLYDYLFENNYEAWFCNLAKTTDGYSSDFSNATSGAFEK
jgi:hypothetical protein